MRVIRVVTPSQLSLSATNGIENFRGNFLVRCQHLLLAGSRLVVSDEEVEMKRLFSPASYLQTAGPGPISSLSAGQGSPQSRVCRTLSVSEINQMRRRKI